MALLPDKVKQWGNNVSQTIQTTASTVVSGVSETAEMVSKKFKDAYSNPSGLINKQTGTGERTPVIMTDAYKIFSGYDLFPIGRPCKFNNTVDPYQRFGNYFRTKMSVIDLVPVDYSFDFNRMAKIVESETIEPETDVNLKNMFGIEYKTNIEVYRRICEYHGLSNVYAGVRLYTTDDTTANDTIQIGYKDSTFQQVTNPLSEIGQSMKDVAASIFGSEKTEYQKKIVSSLESTTESLSQRAGASPTLQQFLKSLTSVSSDLLISGNKMTFPKIWQNTTYTGNLSVNIRLISPYGHPKAIKEFILKPLSYLILLAAPQTINGVTYGGNIPLTIKAYGLNYTVIGSLASIVFRRGGNDSSFNLYRQPLSIDLSLEFQTLFDAFAVFDPGPPKNTTTQSNTITYDKNIFLDRSLIDPNELGKFTYRFDQNESDIHLMTTLGTILTSLKPIGLLDSSVNPNVYGFFEIPRRDDIPEIPSFTPISGNLASTISRTVDRVGKFGEIITNAPTILQEALANAVYNTAKDTVGDISNSASKYINKVGNAVDKVVDAVNKNIF